MNRLNIYITCLYLLITFAISAYAESSASDTLARPVLLTSAGPTQVMLHGVQSESQHLVLEIRSSDIASLPARSTIGLSFDTEITHVTPPRGPSPLNIETAVAGKHITFFLARDPFAFPQPWTYLITIAFGQRPRSGAIAFGDETPQKVTYPSPSTVVPAVPGT